MRLRRKAGHDQDIDDVNNGRRHETAFTKIIERKGTLDESLLLQESYAEGFVGKLLPTSGAIKGLLGSLPTAIRGLRTGKMRSLPKLIPGVHHKLPGDAQQHVKRTYEHAEEHREELNLYITGEEEIEPEADEAQEPLASAVGGGRQDMDKVTEGGSEAAGEAAPTPEADVEPEPDEEGDR